MCILITITTLEMYPEIVILRESFAEFTLFIIYFIHRKREREKDTPTQEIPGISLTLHLVKVVPKVEGRITWKVSMQALGRWDVNYSVMLAHSYQASRLAP